MLPQRKLLINVTLSMDHFNYKVVKRTKKNIKLKHQLSNIKTIISLHKVKR